VKVIPLAGDTQAMSQLAVGRRLSRDEPEISLRAHPDTEGRLPVEPFRRIVFGDVAEWPKAAAC
jgi:hypothetical protein